VFKLNKIMVLNS